MLVWIILFSVLGSIGAITAAASFLLLGDDKQKYLVSLLISFATGTLLASALLVLLPEAIETADGEPHMILPFVLGGILFFFFLEKLIIWRNCQNNSCEVHGDQTAGPIVLVGDAFHNFTDGVVIASAFLTNFTVGLIAGLAIILHEIPQETGDFGILLHSGYSKKKAYVYNTLSSTTTIPAAIISYFILDSVKILVPFMLAISAASFLYIALSDLAPELHKKVGSKDYLKQLILILLGVALMTMLIIVGGHQH